MPRAGSPEPHLQIEPGELWTEFPFSQEFLDSISLKGATQETPPETPPETPVKMTAKTPDLVLGALAADPGLTLAEVATMIGKSLSAVKRAASRLVKEGRLRYVGPRKGGQWETLGDGAE